MLKKQALCTKMMWYPKNPETATGILRSPEGLWLTKNADLHISIIFPDFYHPNLIHISQVELTIPDNKN